MAYSEVVATASPGASDCRRRTQDVQLGCQCEAAPGINGAGRIKAVLPEGFEVSEIYRLAAARDLQLRRLSYRRDTLEEIFLKAMEG